MADDTDSPKDSDVLYDACESSALRSAEQFRKVFAQDDLLALCKDAGLSNVVDLATLMPLVQALSSGNFFISMKQKGGSLCWSLRPRDAARQMQKLSQEEKMVYIMIEESHTNGVWVRHIKKRSNLTDQGLAKVTAKLEKLRLIKAVKNIKSPAQKTFMLFRLAPDDSVTGGSFYDGGELDEAFVEELGNLIIFHVRQSGWIEVKRRKIKKEPVDVITAPDEDTTRGASPEETRGRKKRKLSQTADIEDGPGNRKGGRHEGHTHVQVLQPVDYKYPDTQNIYEFIKNGNFIRESKLATLTIDEIQNVVNMLVWDGKIEAVNNGYRTVLGVKMPTMSGQDDEGDLMGVRSLNDAERRGNGLTDMPCGRCPVRGVCGKGGPINAASCVYYDQWLRLALNEPKDRPAIDIRAM